MDCGSRGEFQENIERQTLEKEAISIEVCKGCIQEAKAKYQAVAP
jgi:hypothetical protein